MKFYKFIIIILIVFLKTGNILSDDNIFSVNNIELIKKVKTTNQQLVNEAIEKGLKIGGHVGMRFLPIWLQQATNSIKEGLLQQGLSLDLASDTAVDFVLGQLGHPRYQGPRYTQYKTKGLVRSPYETLF